MSLSLFISPFFSPLSLSLSAYPGFVVIDGELLLLHGLQLVPVQPGAPRQIKAHSVQYILSNVTNTLIFCNNLLR